MNHRTIAGAILLLLPMGVLCARADERELFFETKIRPILAGTCFACHGDTKAYGGLRVDSLSSLLQGGESGPAITPGKPNDSLLIRAVRRQDSVSAMPPENEKALRPDQIADFAAWVEAGAAWPAQTAKFETAKHWAFEPVQAVAPPSANDRAWSLSAVDAFIQALQEENGMTPASPADKRALLRRITFDLTGLPPEPEELHAFLEDDSPDAFEKVVDRLLASPRYGERWGRHWLDAVRYADARDLIQLPVESDFREAWRYRDWVVAAFNRDLPYDEFVSRQLAGDLMQPVDPAQIDAEALVATGMLAIADFVPGDVDKEQMIADYVNDEIDVVGRAILGLTLACARCHDHKFDPISIEDYYAMAGIFFSTRIIPSPVPGNTPLVRAPLLPRAEIEAIDAQAKRDKARLTELTQIVQVADDREYLSHLQRLLETAAPRDLPAAIDFFHAKREASSPSLADFASARGIDAVALERWLTFLDRPLPPRALQPLLVDGRGAEALAQELATIAVERRERARGDAETEMMRFRADDRRIATNAEGRISLWPDRAGVADDAALPADSYGPMLATATIGGHSRPVVRFDGEAMLQSPRSAPPTGALFAVFRQEPSASAGTRLIGWEDSAVGQHGIGLMPDGAGGLHAILRRTGASGDVVATPPAVASEFQSISVTWGPTGVALFRDGEAIGANQAIDSISSDPAIAAMRIGGPGSGAGRRFRGELCELRVYASTLDDAARRRVEDELRTRWFAPPEALATADESIEALNELYDELMSPRGPYWIAEADRTSAFPEDVRERFAAQREELELLKSKRAVEIPQAVVVQDGGPVGTRHEGFHDSPVYLRGNPATLGKTIPRGFPTAIAGADPPRIAEGSGRRELARWLTRPDHPLTPRVIVNRLWKHHFGEGLVRTAMNFGLRGESPSHPELLDFLSRRFIEAGWSIKAMQRSIVLSNVYRQSAFASDKARSTDPENRWLARMPRRRLEAEAIRDALLAVSGRLDATMGGQAFLEVAAPRRTIYLMSVRTRSKTADFSSLFDGPDGGGILEGRNQSTVAPQALYLLNDPFLDEVSAALAERITSDAATGSDDERIARLYELALGRAPTAEELEIGRRLVADPADKEAWSRYCRVILCTNEFIYVD